MMAKSMGKWQEVIDLIDANYTPFSTMVGYSVTPVKWYLAEAKMKLGLSWIKDLRQANRLHPNHPYILTALAFHEKQVGDRELSLAYCERAQRIMPGDLDIERNVKYLRGLQWRH